MRPRFLWWWFTLAALAAVLGDLLSRLSDSIAGLPEWQQGVVGSVVFAVVSAFFYGFWRLLKATWQWFRPAAVESKQLRKPAPRLGLYDYLPAGEKALAVATAAILTVPDTINAISALIEARADATFEKADNQRRRVLLAQLAKQITPQVTKLSNQAALIGDGVATTIESYAFVFENANLNTLADGYALVTMQRSIKSTVPQTASGLSAMRKRRQIMTGLAGKEQNLNAVAKKYDAALTLIIDSFDAFQAFCEVDLPQLTRRRLSWRMRALLLLGHGVIRP